VVLDDDDHVSIDEMIGRYLPSKQGHYLPALEPTGAAAAVEKLPLEDVPVEPSLKTFSTDRNRKELLH
jgi:hypothetical protein